ncbi:GNAT family N-acetyltransferase [Natronococcus jeotgali]|uniref:Acetyltransferase n=1 Tax=Natronococcus jeotgali DSM 18795 TaxID=1227498 RepID=L9XW21_9EURY|nr:N-acetyltransferase [Natronococcus jeotgali]ELY66004.1 Acetyltransferase [Natronococcus jeotgali DSM 18795]
MELSEFRSKDAEERNAEIEQLFVRVFSDSEGESEGKLIGDLVSNFMAETDSKNLNIFMATEGGEIIGCVIFSRLSSEEAQVNAFLLSPVAVHPDYQGEGIGQKLISFGHDELEKNGVGLVFTYGDIGFYSKVGYEKISEEGVEAPLELSHPEGWLAQSLAADEVQSISGSSYCVEAINKPEYW